MNPLLSYTCGILAYAYLVWWVHSLYEERSKLKERQNVTMAKYESWLGRWFPGWYYLLNGPAILLRNYAPGTVIGVKTPETCYVHFPSSHIKELQDAPEESLSLHAHSRDMFYPERTMHGLQVQDKMLDNGNLHTRVFRVVLRSHLPEMCPGIYEKISISFAAELSGGIKDEDEWSNLGAFSMTKRVITAANALVFFGSNLSNDPVFLEAALSYPEHVFRTSEALRIAPSILHPLIAPILMQNHRASRTMVQYLTPIVQQRIQQVQSVDWKGSGSNDCIQFLIDANDRKKEWSAEKIVQALLGIWFAAVHQPALSLVYILHDLSHHTEYIEPLRSEIQTAFHEGSGISASDLEKLPLLDAFIKESCRLHPSDSISVRRKVLREHTFKDGTRVLPGDVACVPSQAMLCDEDVYDKGATFNPSRFLRNDSGPDVVESSSRFTDTDINYPLWGGGRHACPGRYMASLVIKLSIAHLVMNYDMKSTSNCAPRTFSFRSAIIPKDDLFFGFRAR